MKHENYLWGNQENESYISCTSNPVLLCRFTWGVDDKLFRIWIICGDCLNASDLKTTNTEQFKKDIHVVQEDKKHLQSRLHKGVSFTYITSMSQLCHCKTTRDSVGLSGFKPLLMVALCSKELDGSTPEINLSGQRVLTSNLLVDAHIINFNEHICFDTISKKTSHNHDHGIIAGTNSTCTNIKLEHTTIRAN